MQGGKRVSSIRFLHRYREIMLNLRENKLFAALD